MKITKRQLRTLVRTEKLKLLKENHGDYGDTGEMPCPIATASAMKQAGATDSDVLEFIHKLTMELTSMGGDMGDMGDMDAPMGLDTMGGAADMMGGMDDDVYEGRTLKQMPAAWQQILNSKY
tara:strand:- start:710 stop:1075 length:366 start_codon:yes stop_codon:yes gene_type:complete